MYFSLSDSLVGTNPGDLQTPFNDPPSNELNIFVGDICRPLKLKLAGPIKHMGVDAMR